MYRFGRWGSRSASCKKKKKSAFLVFYNSSFFIIISYYYLLCVDPVLFFGKGDTSESIGINTTSSSAFRCGRGEERRVREGSDGP